MALLVSASAPDPALARRKPVSAQLRKRVMVLLHYLARIEGAIP